MLEVFGFVLVPCVLFAFGHRNCSLGIIRLASILALLGILLNRLKGVLTSTLIY